MNRREFGKTAGLVAVASVVVPKVLAEPFHSGQGVVHIYRDVEGNVQKEGTIFSSAEDMFLDRATSAQREAMQKARDNMPPAEIFTKVASEIPQQVPDGTDKKGYQHGAVRMMAAIDGYDPSFFEMGLVHPDVDLSDIGYVVLYRQAVRNKYTNKIKFFASSVPLDFARSVHPGQTIPVNKKIAIGTSHDEIERMARESFLKLQELVVEYHNREL